MNQQIDVTKLPNGELAEMIVQRVDKVQVMNTELDILRKEYYQPHRHKDTAIKTESRPMTVSDIEEITTNQETNG